MFAAVPGPPAAPEICNILSTSCTVRFQPPVDGGDAPVTGYHVQRCVVMSDKWVPANESPVTDLEFVDKHLSPLSRYQFRVAAENRFGMGAFGVPSKFITTDQSVCIKLSTFIF